MKTSSLYRAASDAYILKTQKAPLIDDYQLIKLDIRDHSLITSQGASTLREREKSNYISPDPNKAYQVRSRNEKIEGGITVAHIPQSSSVDAI